MNFLQSLSQDSISRKLQKLCCGKKRIGAQKALAVTQRQVSGWGLLFLEATSERFFGCCCGRLDKKSPLLEGEPSTAGDCDSGKPPCLPSQMHYRTAYVCVHRGKYLFFGRAEYRAKGLENPDVCLANRTRLTHPSTAPARQLTSHVLLHMQRRRALLK